MAIFCVCVCVSAGRLFRSRFPKELTAKCMAGCMGMAYNYLVSDGLLARQCLVEYCGVCRS